MPPHSANPNKQRGLDYNRGGNLSGRYSSSNPGGQRDGAEPDGGARLRMVCGDCCLPSCYVKERVKMALEHQLDAATSGEYAVVECTSAECHMGGQLHRECYEKLEERCLAVFSNVTGRVRDPKPEAEIRRNLWKGGSKGYYNRISKLCTCACGRGVFRPIDSTPGHVTMRGQHAEGEDAAGEEDAAEARTRAIAQKLERKRELQEARARLQREQRERDVAEATQRNERLRQRRQELARQVALRHASEQGVNPAAYEFDPSDGTKAAAAARAAAAAAAARAVAEREAAARDELRRAMVFQLPALLVLRGSAPARPQRLLSARLAAPGQLGTPRVRPSHWDPIHGLGGSSGPPPKDARRSRRARPCM